MIAFTGPRVQNPTSTREQRKEAERTLQQLKQVDDPATTFRHIFGMPGRSHILRRLAKLYPQHAAQVIGAIVPVSCRARVHSCCSVLSPCRIPRNRSQGPPNNSLELTLPRHQPFFTPRALSQSPRRMGSCSSTPRLYSRR